MSLQTIDMKSIRCLNLFSKISGVRTSNCFSYNNTLIFATPQKLISKAIGKGGENVQELSRILQKKVKIVALPRDLREIEGFISNVISPITFKTLEVFRDEIVITSNKQTKAALIGRDKVRLIELSKIIKDFFGKNLKII